MFSGGGDLGADIAQQALAGGDDFVVEMYRHVQAEYPIFHAIESCPKTTVAAINGHAFGAAVDIAMMCDLVLAVRGAKLTFAPGKWGLADTPNATRLTQRIGIGRTKDLLFTARPLSAEEGERIGLVNRLCDRAEFDEAIVRYAEEILTTSPDARRLVKDVIVRQLPPFSTEEHFETAVGEDFKAGVRAFSKREPAPWTAPGLARR
jgi:enoyl-CoA hydratase/carnithine racemase